MHRSLCLLLIQLGLCIHCYILHPNYSYNQNPGDTQILEKNPLQSKDWAVDEGDTVRGLSENRMERHVDAIFTNTYRKFLGQISARRYLQNMIGKHLG
ncbi:somatoliberin [Rhinophrynus dorsalis]